MECRRATIPPVAKQRVAARKNSEVKGNDTLEGRVVHWKPTCLSGKAKSGRNDIPKGFWYEEGKALFC